MDGAQGSEWFGIKRTALPIFNKDRNFEFYQLKRNEVLLCIASQKLIKVT